MNQLTLTFQQASRNTDPIIYKDIPGYPGYRAGSNGTIWTSKLGANGGWRKLKFAKCKIYPRVMLSHKNIKKSFNVHELILLAFIGPRPDGLVSRHLDGEPFNNKILNLCYGTYKENEADKKRHGRHLYGERVNGAKLTDNDVLYIRKLYLKGEKIKDIAKKYHVDVTSIINAVHGYTFSHLPVPDYSNRPQNKGGPPRGSKHFGSKLTEKKVKKIKMELKNGIRQRVIAKKYGVSRSNIGHIAQGSIWGWLDA